ncbi:efflux RND transporter periplasmic adaptor subunit [Uliginosibacterium sediminicola]
MQTNKQLSHAGIGLAVMFGLLLGACSKAPQSGQPQGGPSEVGVVTIAPQTVALSSELPGRTSAFQIAEVRPQVNGIIKNRLFTEGGEVKAGAPLYLIDPATYQATLDSAQAALAKAEATVASTRAKAQRYEELASIKAVSQQDRDDAVAAQKQAEADVAVAKANVATARINLAYTNVAAPISGRIGKSEVTAGALVTANQTTALSTIQQLDPIYVDVTQSNAELLRLRQDLKSGRLKSAGANQARVKLLLEDGSVYPLEGKLTFADVTVDQDTGSVTLRAIFPNPEHVLLPGMYVRARVEQGLRENAILVPQQGVTRDTKGNATAMVLNAEDKVEPRVLKTERAVGDKWLVSEGLSAGDRLIVEGLQRVRPGAPAKAVAAGASAPAAAK